MSTTASAISEDTIQDIWSKPKKKTIPLTKYERRVSALLSNSEALRFLDEQRGLTKETAERLKLGFKQSHVYRVKNEANRDKGWICFPRIYSEEILAMKFRSIAEKDFSQVDKMNTKTWFNHDTINPFQPIFVTEGEFDACILEQAGFCAVSAPSAGAKITPEMKDALKLAPAIYLAGDNDGGVGSDYMRKLSEELATEFQDISVYRIIWPDAKDANEYFLKVCNRDSLQFKSAVERLMSEATCPETGQTATEPRKIEEIPVEVVTMGEDVLEGRLGEICLGLEKKYALPRDLLWPSLLTGASVITKAQGTRKNLYTFLHAAPRKGKGAAATYALATLGLIRPSALEDGSWDFEAPCHDSSFGSFEGFAKEIGDKAGAPILWYLDELKILLKKAAIEGASFYPALEKLWSHSRYKMTIKNQEKVEFNATLSILGGIQPSAYTELFGPEADGGMAKRVLYGWLQDATRPFKYIRFEGKAEELNTSKVALNANVYEELARWQDSEGIDSGVAEIALRSAVNTASIDGKTLLTANDLRSALALARNQMKAHEYLKPGTGSNDGGKVTNLVMKYLDDYGQNHRWVTAREIGRNRNAYSYGATLLGNTIRELGRHGGYEVREVETGGRPRLEVRKAYLA